MDRSRFQELQYQTLRKEIEDCLTRAFQVMVGGATLIPILVGVIGHYSATPILLALPMMVVVTALLYINQWNMIMRSGRYIRTRIEPEFMGSGGWEGWLESAPDSKIGEINNRLVDTYLAYAFYLLIGAYYLGTSYIAVTYAYHSYGPIAMWASLGAYILIGIVMAFIVLRRVPTNTTTKKERSFAQHQVVVVLQPEDDSVTVVDAVTTTDEDDSVTVVDAVTTNVEDASPGAVLLDDESTSPARTSRNGQ
jgi:uncharacterized membrane protein YraQ (UPF0718 family)